MANQGELFVVIIVNTIAPYCFEINNIMALPVGFTYRFRYQKKKQGEWMPEIKNPKTLKGCNALVVLREFLTTAKLIPIRKIYINNVLVIGDIVYIEYELKERVTFSSDPDRRNEQIELFNRRIITDIKTDRYPNSPNQNLKNLVFMGTDYTYDFKDEDYQGEEIDKDSNNWGNLIELIGTFNNTGIEVYKDFDFIKITGLIDEFGNPARPQKIKDKLFYILENRVVYNLQFLQRTYTGSLGNSAVIKPRDIVLISDPSEVKLIIPRLNILGKYDLLSFAFRSEISSFKKNTILMLQFCRGNEVLPLPSIIIPIQIRYSWIEKIITIGSLAVFVIASIAYWTADILVPTGSAQILRNILLPIMIVFGGEVLRSLKDLILSKITL